MTEQRERSRIIGQPEPGHFRMRLVRKGWQVPAKIAFDPDTGLWTATIDGVEQPPNTDPTLAGCDSIWESAERIDVAHWRYLESVREHALRHQPDHPCLHPRKPINPALMKPLLPTR